MLPKSELKYIQSLNHKKFRQEYGHFVAEGPKLVQELLARQPDLLHKLFATNEWYKRQEPGVIAVIGNRFQLVEAFELEKISNLQNAQDVLAIVNIPLPAKAAAADLSQPAWKLALDGIQDPGNMGTIIRTAHWFGIENVICSLDCADVFSPKVVQSSMGSIFGVNVIYTDLADDLAENKLPVYGALLKGESVRKKHEYAKGIILIGNEGQGIRPALVPYIDHPVTVPGIGDAESLNAAVAAGILLYSFTH